MRNGSESVRKKPQVSLPYCIHAFQLVIGVLLGDDTLKNALLGDDTQKPLVGRVVQKSLSDEVDKKTPFAIY